MNDSLDYSEQELETILQKTMALVLDQYARVDQQDGFHHFPQNEVASWFDEPLPLDGSNALELLDLVKHRVLDTATGNLGPNRFIYGR